MDLKVIETNNGGDLIRTTKDLVTLDGFENMPYLALFGGNVAASTPLDRLPTEQDFSWWGNNLLIPNDPGLQFNSETERALLNTPLTSQGRFVIQEAVKRDLRFMRDFARVAVAVSIVATDKVVIGIQLEQPDNLQRREFLYIWDATKQELGVLPDSSSPAAPGGNGFNYLLDFVFI